jgi:hypothetical protein
MEKRTQGNDDDQGGGIIAGAMLLCLLMWFACLGTAIYEYTQDRPINAIYWMLFTILWELLMWRRPK